MLMNFIKHPYLVFVGRCSIPVSCGCSIDFSQCNTCLYRLYPICSLLGGAEITCESNLYNLFNNELKLNENKTKKKTIKRRRNANGYGGRSKVTNSRQIGSSVSFGWEYIVVYYVTASQRDKINNSCLCLACAEANQILKKRVQNKIA